MLRYSIDAAYHVNSSRPVTCNESPVTVEFNIARTLLQQIATDGEKMLAEPGKSVRYEFSLRNISEVPDFVPDIVYLEHDTCLESEIAHSLDICTDELELLVDQRGTLVTGVVTQIVITITRVEPANMPHYII